MSLRPSGASMLEVRSKIRCSSPSRSSRRDNGSVPTDQATATESSDRSVGTLQKFFNAAMDRYLAEQREANKDPASTCLQHQRSQDVEMESIRSSDHGYRWEFPTSAQVTVATAAAGSTGPTMIQRVRISAISDLKAFTGKDQDEDRGRAWISKVKSAFMWDQASDDEKCLTFADLLAGSAKNWYRQLSRSTRNKWSELLRSFQIQYCGLGVSERREHVDHYIETLEDQDLAERLTLLRLADADDLEEAAFGSSKYRQKPTNSTPSAPAKQVRAIQIQHNDSGSDSESDGSGGSDSDVDNHRKIFFAANEDVTPKVEKESATLDPRLPEREQGHQDYNLKIHGNGFNRDRCSHCESRKHSDLGCWRRVTCTKVGKRGHPSDHCLFVCRGCGELHDMGKCPMEEFYNQIRHCREYVKLGRSSVWNPIRTERCRYCIYAFVNKTSVDQVSKRPDLHGNTCDLHGKRTFAISSLRQVDEYARSEGTMSVGLQPGESRGYCRQHDPDLLFKPTDHEVTPEIQKPSKIAEYQRSTTMELLPGESLGYWKHHSPAKWFRQAKITGKIHNEIPAPRCPSWTPPLLVGCYIDSSQIQDCVGIGDNVYQDNVYQTEEGIRIKATLAGSLVYFFDIWVGDLTGQQAILGMDFMVPAGIRLDLAHVSISLPDEVRIQLSGRRQLYSDKAKIVNVGQYLRIQAGESVELPLRLRSSIHDKLWVTRGNQWVPTISSGPGRTEYISITNIGDEVFDHASRPTDRDLAGDHVPRIPGFISIGSRRYMEWQNLALEATTDTRSEEMEVKVPLVPAVERPEYKTPRAILQRPKATLIQCRKVEASQDQGFPDCPPSDESPSDKSLSDKSPSEMRPLDLASVANEESDLSSIADEDSISHAVTVKEVLEDRDQVTPDIWIWKECEKKMTELKLRMSVWINDMREANIKEHRRRKVADLTCHQ
ncbi:LOW QUALITY PROTEIN: hypothetical protein PHMEG_00029463 [Phytophthora megakarya]|uniref:Eukaryotic/viral aspartic protease n=1 Tax=Phytophthora megakarya TaxID=4795 RepID=A0A225V2G8_9STRA|nr:LOW QUALITY PROTEIN: hypothetical protein PHMEG_00029463 [Phytophthora megakarya]